MGAQLTLDLSHLYSSMQPRNRFVFALGSFHSGTKHNIIPAEANLQGNLRSLDKNDHDEFKLTMTKAVEGIATKFGVSSEKQAIKFSGYFPITFNNIDLTRRIAPVYREVAGADNALNTPPIMASEDFAQFSLENKIPTSFFFIGGKPETVDANWGSNHNAYFAPDYKKAFPIAVSAMVGAILELHKK